MVIGKNGFEECAELEVILLQERIIFVVVAAGALEAKSEEDVGGGVGDFGEYQVPLAAGVAVVVFVDPVSEEAGGDGCSGVIGKEFVSGELFLQETVVGFVLIERLNNVIAVAPGIRAVEVGSVAVGIGVADEIQPMAGPAFAIGGAVKELVDEAFPCVRATIVEEVFDLFWSGGESGDFEGESAEECEAVCFGSGGQVLAEHGVEEKAVDLVAAP